MRQRDKVVFSDLNLRIKNIPLSKLKDRKPKDIGNLFCVSCRRELYGVGEALIVSSEGYLCLDCHNNFSYEQIREIKNKYAAKLNSTTHIPNYKEEDGK